MQDYWIAGVPPALSAEREKLATNSLRSLSDSIQAVQESVPACAICGKFFCAAASAGETLRSEGPGSDGKRRRSEDDAGAIFALRAQCGRDARDPDTRDSVPPYD